MKLIVGLGNPGKEYEKTRHNAGFLTVDNLQLTVGSSDWKLDKKCKAEISKGGVDGEKAILAKPQTFMNKSGEAVAAIIQYSLSEARRAKSKGLRQAQAILLKNLWIIHDDLDLPLGKLKISFGSGSAGHKGVQSIIDALNTKNFWRLRIGIAPSLQPSPTGGKGKREKAEKFVLQPFKKEEQKLLKETLDKTVKVLTLALKDPQRAMNQFN